MADSISLINCSRSLQTPRTLSCTKELDNSTVILSCEKLRNNEIATLMVSMLNGSPVLAPSSVANVAQQCEPTLFNRTVHRCKSQPFLLCVTVLATLAWGVVVFRTMRRNDRRQNFLFSVRVVGGITIYQLTYHYFDGIEWVQNLLTWSTWAVVALCLVLVLKQRLAPASNGEGAKQLSRQERGEVLPHLDKASLEGDCTASKKG